MLFNFSATVERLYPELQVSLQEIAEEACGLDTSIQTDCLLVNARMYPGSHTFSGLAWPYTRSSYGGWDWEHENGRVDLRVSKDMTSGDFIWLFGHELKHIGQFHRGRDRNGYLGTFLSNKTCEAEAYAFGDVLLETMTRRTGN